MLCSRVLKILAVCSVFAEQLKSHNQTLPPGIELKPGSLV
jgi:hypothetical protein